LKYSVKTHLFTYRSPDHMTPHLYSIHRLYRPIRGGQSEVSDLRSS